MRWVTSRPVPRLIIVLCLKWGLAFATVGCIKWQLHISTRDHPWLANLIQKEHGKGLLGQVPPTSFSSLQTSHIYVTL